MTSSSEVIKVESEKTVRPPVEKDKRHLIRQQLYYLFHAFRCTRLSYTTGQGDCQNQHCIMMRSVVKHIPQCEAGKECTFPHCPSSKEIIKHWKKCNDVECQVCAPLRRNNNARRIDENVNNDNRSREFNNYWKSKLTKIREKLVVKLTDHILPVKVCEDVRNHPSYTEVADYVKNFECEAYRNSETMHIYICQLSRKFEMVFHQIYSKRCTRENDLSVFNSLTDTTDERLDKFYNLIKGEIEKFYMSIGGNIHDLFEPICTVKEEKTIKTETDYNQNNGSSESSLKTVSSETNSFVKTEVDSPPNSTVITPTKPISSSEVNTDVKMSPDSTSDPNKNITNTKHWTKEELIDLFSALHQELVDEKESEPFKTPVDWKRLEIPDYPIIIKHPMDLSTIKEKMINNEYTEPWEIVNDYWLMFNNAWVYNKKTSKVYKMCNTLARIFESRIDDIMTANGFCCGRSHVYLPQVIICCSPSCCLIGRDAVYYAFQNDKTNPETFCSDLPCDRYIFCEKCYNDNIDEIPVLSTENNTTCYVKKSNLSKTRNNEKENEEFVNCRICNRKWHKVCADHSEEIWREGFHCPACIAQYNIKKKENMFKARHLPHNELSRHIETRINSFLKERDPSINEVVIRVLSSSDKVVEVKPGMKSHYSETCEMPESFNYRLKALFAFQEIDGQEVCFFGLLVQEYGSDCPDPNSRRVYIAYLDSVHFFSPRKYRTDVYHEFLVGYLEYVKKIGFTMAHIWACPPGEGDDYIFHMHPPEQKLPKPKRLQDWYIKMLDKAMKENIVVDYKDIFSDALHSKMLSPTELPYFEGDYWPNALEDIIKEIDEETNRRMKTYSENQPNSETDGAHKDIISKNNLSKMDKKPKKRKLKRMNSTNNKRKRCNGSESVNDVSRRVLELMEKRKENFFVIRLHTQVDAANLPEIKDPDALVSSDLMDGRDKFLNMARERHLEFSSLRRAKYSSLIFCYELHMEHRLYSCNTCGRQIDLRRYTCRQCEDFELCESCYLRESHPHPLICIEADDVEQMIQAIPNSNGKIPIEASSENTNNTDTNSSMPAPTSNTANGTGIVNSTTSSSASTNNNNCIISTCNTLNGDNNNECVTLTANNNVNTSNANGNNAELQDTTRARMVRYSQGLQHACQCRDVNCRINFCDKMKGMIKHHQCCALPRQTCKVCFTFLRVCIVHAKFCNDPKCQVPNCLSYRYSWKQQGSHQRMQQAQMLRRRVALMHRGTSVQNGDSSNSIVTNNVTTNVTTTTNSPLPTSVNSNNANSGKMSAFAVSGQSVTTPQEEITNRSFNGKVPDPIHEEMIKHQQLNSNNQVSALNSGKPTSMLTMTGSGNGEKPMIPLHTIPPYQATVSQPMMMDHNQHLQQQQQQMMMSSVNPIGPQSSPVVSAQPITINAGPQPQPIPPSPYPSNGISDEDIKIVRQRYFYLSKTLPPEEFKRQWYEFLSMNPRYRIAFDFISRSYRHQKVAAAAGVSQHPTVVNEMVFHPSPNGATMTMPTYHHPHHQMQQQGPMSLHYQQQHHHQLPSMGVPSGHPHPNVLPTHHATWVTTIEPSNQQPYPPPPPQYHQRIGGNIGLAPMPSTQSQYKEKLQCYPQSYFHQTPQQQQQMGNRFPNPNNNPVLSSSNMVPPQQSLTPHKMPPPSPIPQPQQQPGNPNPSVVPNGNIPTSNNIYRYQPYSTAPPPPQYYTTTAATNDTNKAAYHPQQVFLSNANSNMTNNPSPMMHIPQQPQQNMLPISQQQQQQQQNSLINSSMLISPNP